LDGCVLLVSGGPIFVGSVNGDEKVQVIAAIAEVMKEVEKEPMLSLLPGSQSDFPVLADVSHSLKHGQGVRVASTKNLTLTSPVASTKILP
jgi:hypothetical protein